MTPEPPRAWPPIISDARLSRGLILRDVVLTALAWIAFAWAFAVNFEVGWHALRMRRGLILIAVLVAVLGLSTLVSRRRRQRALHDTPPAPAPDSDLARDLGLDAAGLEALRTRRVLVVDMATDGKLVVAPPGDGEGGRT